MAKLSVARMRAIDTWVGQPLCTVLGALSLLSRKLRPPPAGIPPRPRRVIVMKFFGLGSLVQAGPMLRAIREAHPEARLVFLTFDSCAPLIRGMGLCHEIWCLRTTSLWRFSADLLRQLVRFAAQPIDVCIDLEFFSKFSTWMSLMSGARVRVAFHLNNFWRSSVVTHPVYYNYYRHVSDVYSDAATRIGAPVRDRSLCRIEVGPQCLERARQRLVAEGWNGSDRLVGVNVNAGDLALERRWPRQRFAAVVERLTAQPNVAVALTGSPEEVPYVAGVTELLSPPARRRVLDVSGKLSFEEFVATMDLYDFFLTSDSGPLHVANAQGADTISFWGPIRPSFYGPRGERHSTFYRGFWCSPCLNMFTSQAGQWCDHRADCLQAIQVDEVWPTISAYLEHSSQVRAAFAVREGW